MGREIRSIRGKLRRLACEASVCLLSLNATLDS